jgi:hypothetical protein
MDLSMLELATTIHRDAGNLAPRDSGALVASGKVSRKDVGHYQIQFGGGQVKYAKRRHYENRKNPQTIRYLLNAGDRNAKSFVRYLKGKS